MRTWVGPESEQITPHSVVMELWVSSGVAGLVLGLYLLWLAVLLAFRSLGDPTVSAAGVFIGLVCIWDLMFSPMISGRDLLLAGVAFLVLSRRAAQDQVGGAPRMDANEEVLPRGREEFGLQDQVDRRRRVEPG